MCQAAAARRRQIDSWSGTRSPTRPWHCASSRTGRLPEAGARTLEGTQASRAQASASDGHSEGLAQAGRGDAGGMPVTRRVPA